MSYPTQQPFPPQGYPPQAPPAQPYPPQQQPYPPQQYAPQQGYPAQQPFPPQQGYGQPAQQPLAAGSLDAFWNQPSAGGGAALKFPTPGTSHVGVVARQITNADIQQQTQPGTGAPAFYKDGRAKFVMKVPLQLPAPTQDNEDGLAQWYCSGGARDELVRAMADAGAPAGPPEVGAALRITFTGTRAAGAGMTPAKVFRVEYVRPSGAAPAAPPQPPAPEQQAPPPMAPQVPPLAPQVPAPEQQAPPQPAPPAAPAPNGTADLTPDQQALLAQLTGQPAPAAG